MRDRLKMLDESQRKAIATLLLHFALKENMKCPIFHGSLFRDVEMFSLLLDLGAGESQFTTTCSPKCSAQADDNPAIVIQTS